jgi:hypothetical protein
LAAVSPFSFASRVTNRAAHISSYRRNWNLKKKNSFFGRGCCVNGPKVQTVFFLFYYFVLVLFLVRLVAAVVHLFCRRPWVGCVGKIGVVVEMRFVQNNFPSFYWQQLSVGSFVHQSDFGVPYSVVKTLGKKSRRKRWDGRDTHA